MKSFIITMVAAACVAVVVAITIITLSWGLGILGNSHPGVPPPVQPIPDAYCPQPQGAAVADDMKAIMLRFLNEAKGVSKMTRAELVAVNVRLWAIRNTMRDYRAPECAAEAKRLSLGAMDAMVQCLDDIIAGKPADASLAEFERLSALSTEAMRRLYVDAGKVW